MEDRKVISFAGTCDARGELTLVSDRIAYPYFVRQLEVDFAEGCQNLMLVKFFTSADDHAPSSGEPSDVSLLQELSPNDYVRGNARQITMAHTTRVDVGGTYLKVYANNTDYFDHDVNARVEIEPLIGAS